MSTLPVLRIPCLVTEEDGVSGLVVTTAATTFLKIYGFPGHVVPRGFRSDGMSVPRFLWRWLGASVCSVTLAPSIVHDWLYSTHIVTRKVADGWYRRQLRANGYSFSKSWTVWLGLRLFGASHW